MIRCWAAALMLLSASSALAQNERALSQLWEQHTTNLTNHVAVLRTCEVFKKQYPGDAFTPVVDTLAAWHLFRLGKGLEAVARYKPYLLDSGGDSIKDGASMQAKSWLTRVERERLKKSLQHFYKKEIRYPASIKELAAFEDMPEGLKPSIQDHWGRSWGYKLTGFKKIPGLIDQKYELMSTKLGPSSVLTEGIKLPYGEAIQVKALSVESKQAVQLSNAAEGGTRRSLLGEGSRIDNVLLAYVGERIIILGDENHWKILPRPNR